jgi:hypothetical protein
LVIGPTRRKIQKLVYGQEPYLEASLGTHPVTGTGTEDSLTGKVFFPVFGRAHGKTLICVIFVSFCKSGASMTSKVPYISSAYIFILRFGHT